MPKGRYRIMRDVHAEARLARSRHDDAHVHRAGQPRLRVRGRHGEEVPRVAGDAADRDRAVRRLAVHRRQAERLPRSARKSGATPIRTAPACSASCSRTASVTSATSTTSSTCRCTSSTATANTSMHPGSRSATSWTAGCRRLPGERPTLKDWADHMTTAFPEVRLKQYLEMRGADGGPVEPPVRAAGVLGRAAVRQHRARRGLGPGQGLHAGRARGAARRRAHARVPAAVPRRHRARPGAGARWRFPRTVSRVAHKLNRHGADESVFLEPMIEFVEAGQTPADRKLELFHGRVGWQRRSGVHASSRTEFTHLEARGGELHVGPLPRRGEAALAVRGLGVLLERALRACQAMERPAVLRVLGEVRA